MDLKMVPNMAEEESVLKMTPIYKLMFYHDQTTENHFFLGVSCRIIN